MYKRQANGIQGGSSELAALWEKAVRDYVQKTKGGKKLVESESFRVRNMSDVMSQVESQGEGFVKSRNQDSKTGELRSTFSRNVGNMKRCLACVQAVGNAAAAFPPAAPVSLVFSACNQLLGSFAAVSDDYDKIEEFFAYSGRFFDQITLLENEVDSGPLARCVVQVFSTMLTICGIAQAMTEEKRFKHWLHKLWNLEDGEMTAAFASMQAYIEELGRTVGYASYKAIREAHKEIQQTHTETVKANEKLDQMDDQIKSLYPDLQELVHQNTLEVQRSVFDMGHFVVENVSALVLSLQKQQRSKNAPEQEDTTKHDTKSVAKRDLRDKKIAAIRSIKNFLNERDSVYPAWEQAQKENQILQKDIQDTFIARTGEWLTDGHQEFSSWLNGENHLLWIRGSDGIGKTFLTQAIINKLDSLPDPKSIACFYFKEEQYFTQSAENAFACTALQVAASNTKYAEHLASRLESRHDSKTAGPTWKRFFTSMFPAGASDPETDAHDERLFMVFDGLDEAAEDQITLALQFFAELEKEKTNVHIVVTSRTESCSSMRELSPIVVDIAKESILNDIKLLIVRRMKTLPRLRKFSSAVQKRIARKMAKQADGFLYVEHALRRLSYIGREGAVLKELENLPGSLHDLYKLLLNDCRKNRSTQQYEALKKLFAWLAYSKRSLSLAEAAGLVNLTVAGSDHFDIEDEIIGRSARILELSRDRAVEGDGDQENYDDDEADDQIDHDEDNDTTQQYRYDSLVFQERSMRQYFRIVSADDENEDLRTPLRAAHLDILDLSTSIMSKLAGHPDDPDAKELQNYAVNYWYEHFMEINMDIASDDEVWKVIGALHRLMTASRELAHVIESCSWASDLYPERKPESGPIWLDRMLEWIKRGNQCCDSAPNIDVREWAAEIVQFPKNALIPLARAHIQNWFRELRSSDVKEAYEFAKGALRLCDRLQHENESCEQILSVANAFDDIDKDAKAMRAIALILASVDPQTETIWENANAYFEKSLTMETGNDDINKFLTRWSLCFVNQGEENLETTLQRTMAARDSLPKNLRVEWATALVDLIFLQTTCLKGLGRIDDAIAAYDEARKLAGDGQLSGARYDEILSIFTEEIDPTGQKQIDAIKSWTEKDRHKFFDYIFDDDEEDVFWRVSRAAKTSGENEYLLDTLDIYRKKKPARSDLVFTLLIQLVSHHRHVLGDRQKAKALAKDALNMKVEPTDVEWTEYNLSFLRMELADIVHLEFRESSDPHRKAELVEELRGIAGETPESDGFATESNIGMMLACMLYVMGPAVEYQKIMDGLFQSCIGGLEDSVSWNDSNCLRLLAKVLGALPSLERDALIAISAQFSVLDKSLLEEEEESEEDTDSEASQSDGSTGPNQEQHILKPTSQADGPDEEMDSQDEELPELDEDIHPESVNCDGCSVSIERYSRPFYYCLVCPNTDLCVKCHAARLAQNRGEQAAPWKSYCGKDHAYIKGPMRHWRGIKDGTIRIGDEEFTVKDWLKGLKEEGWKKAWESFWLGGEPLRSIEG